MLGRPIEIRYRSGLTDTAGNPAHAATFIRQRLILLDKDLTADGAGHERILWHELFHFAWVRLGNSRRLDWERLLATELRARVRGEAGWSAEWRKRCLRWCDITNRTRRWREYCCESFCDTAAWILTSNESELTLSNAARNGRKLWFARHIELKEIRV